MTYLKQILKILYSKLGHVTEKRDSPTHTPSKCQI